jgi:hypothetical protein
MRGEAHTTVVDQRPSLFADLRGARSCEHPASRGSPPNIQRCVSVEEGHHDANLVTQNNVLDYLLFDVVDGRTGSRALCLLTHSYDLPFGMLCWFVEQL